jgi:hypothetical protein
MKKILALVAFALFAASQVYAATVSGATIVMDSDLTSTSAVTGKSLYGDTQTTPTAASPLIGKTSTGVAVSANTSSTGYAMVTQHKSGNRVFGTAYDSTSVFYQDATVGVAGHATVSNTGSAEFNSGWSSM